MLSIDSPCSKQGFWVRAEMHSALQCVSGSQSSAAGFLNFVDAPEFPSFL